MPFATRPRGVRIHYETHGAGKPSVVLIQGLGLPASLWFDVPNRLAGAADPWHVVTPNHRGVGRSDRPFGLYTMGLMADDVAAVLDHAGVDRAYVVGLSLGGMVAQHLALRHASRVAGLVLMATTAGFPHVLPPNPLTLLNFLSLPLTGRLHKNRLDRSFARLLLAERDVARSDEFLAGWPEALRDRPTSVGAYLAHFGAVLGHSTGWRLGRIACPTVIVTGDDDALLPHHNGRWIAERIPGAHLEVVPGGHILPATDPEVVPRALARVRGENERKPGEGPTASAASPSAGADQMLKAPVRSR